MSQFNNQLVSTIIPCYNAGRWVRQAVDSCLAQTYRPIEVIVVDDGSTDDSADILRRYGDRIRFVQQPHTNGNRARNAGMAMSRGRYLQFLDADDYLLPEKIASQVALLQETEDDAVYCDYAILTYKDGAPQLGPFKTNDARPDLLTASLLGHWVPGNTLLWRREAVVRLGGWDESLLAAQDFDLVVRAALQGLRLRYQPGPWVVVRRYGNVTVSTSDPLRLLLNCTRVLEKVEHELLANEGLRRRYTSALARAYFRTARQMYSLDKHAAEQLVARYLALNPTCPPHYSRAYNLVYRWLGLGPAEAAVRVWRRLRRMLIRGSGG
jgi:glycosyltransferase involved in cell wall biosynthesis